MRPVRRGHVRGSLPVSPRHGDLHDARNCRRAVLALVRPKPLRRRRQLLLVPQCVHRTQARRSGSDLPENRRGRSKSQGARAHGNNSMVLMAALASACFPGGGRDRTSPKTAGAAASRRGRELTAITAWF